MGKPKPKKEVAIKFLVENVNLIVLNASKDAIEEFKDFGLIRNYYDGSYCLTVDSRYDYNEVLEYIENYG